jgi:hypothetical protein
VLKKGAFSEKDEASLGDMVPAVNTPDLYAAIVCAELVPSE